LCRLFPGESPQKGIGTVSLEPAREGWVPRAYGSLATLQVERLSLAGGPGF